MFQERNKWMLATQQRDAAEEQTPEPHRISSDEFFQQMDFYRKSGSAIGVA